MSALRRAIEAEAAAATLSRRVEELKRERTLAETDMGYMEERIRELERALGQYANPDNWECVKSPESTSAWEKRFGHPTPWVDARRALEDS